MDKAVSCYQKAADLGNMVAIRYLRELKQK